MTQQEQLKESKAARRKAIMETHQLSAPREGSHKVLNFLLAILAILGIVLFADVFYMLAWPVHPLALHSVTMVGNSFSSKGSLTYKIDACKNTDVTPTVYRKLVGDHHGVPLLATQGVANRGCGVTFVTVKLTTGTPPGQYRLYTDVVYQVNVFRSVHVYWHTAPFEVTP